MTSILSPAYWHNIHSRHYRIRSEVYYTLLLQSVHDLTFLRPLGYILSLDTMKIVFFMFRPSIFNKLKHAVYYGMK